MESLVTVIILVSLVVLLFYPVLMSFKVIRIPVRVNVILLIPMNTAALGITMIPRNFKLGCSDAYSYTMPLMMLRALLVVRLPSIQSFSVHKKHTYISIP
ncbi:hypothetical protein BDA99DRAFT_521817 [Phascolomyces articulosus]|uniref:Uncharacterized protein n=1 Tax=Phascolomyces articulosus TaxID=60185 RepID=A0AAD5PBG7_9FUNG|nr:hypothetical protein BDA99DRAFT_521817 [Phascolomyces articulosus]